MTSIKQHDIRGKIKELAIGTVALLTMTVPMLGTAAAQTDETFSFVGSAKLPFGQATYYNAFVDPTLGKYFLADRTSPAIDVLPTGVLPNPTLSQLGFNEFVGLASGGNTSGPNGVITANNHTEVWAGDGPDPTTLTSHVVVINIASNTVTHRIDTGGVMRADKLCENPKKNMVLVANDDPKDLFLSFISTSKYKVIGKIKLDGTDPNGAFVTATNATSAIGQCQWDASTGNFYVAVPEVGGPGDNSAPGAVLVINPNQMNVHQVFAVDHTQCVGPQGMAIGPNPQILLGCSGVGTAPYAEPLTVTAPGSVIISKIDGSRLFSLTGLNGVDQVWYNPTNNSYFLAADNNTIDSGGTATLTPQIGVADAGAPLDQTGPLDQSIFVTGPGAASIAVDPGSKLVYSAIPFSITMPCGAHTEEACVFIFGVTSGTDDPPAVVGKK